MSEKGQLYRLELPGGEVVEAVITLEMLAIGKRVQAAMNAGKKPDPHDLARLLAWAETGGL